MKTNFLKIFIVLALGLIILVPGLALASSSLLFDRGLPNQYLNDYNAPNPSPNRSNVCWADGYYALATPTSYKLEGDDFTIGISGVYTIDKVRVWTVDDPPPGGFAYTLVGGQAGGAMAIIPSTSTVTAVTYQGGAQYKGNSSSFYPIYQVDFAVNWTVTGGYKYQFFANAPLVNYGTEESPAYATPFLHASNKDLSGSTQQGADNLMLELAVNSGVFGAVTSFDSADPLLGIWDKSSDGNVQVYGTTPLPGSMLLLGSGLVGLGFLGRRRLLKRS